jgi:hypothetical protein
VTAIWQQLAVGDTVAAQFISHYCSGLGATAFYYSLKTSLRGCTITHILYINIDHFAVLVNGTP